MFQFEWADLNNNNDNQTIPNNLYQDLDLNSEVMLVEWEEHCLECAPPLCYITCSNYLERNDLKCRLMKFGIIPHFDSNSGLPCAQVFFRKWAKLETIYLSHYYIKFKNLRYFYLVNKYILNLINFLYKYFPFLKFDKKKRLNGIYSHTKRLLFSYLNNRKRFSYTLEDEILFKFSCYSYSQKFNLIFESGNVKFSFAITPGYNSFEYRFGNRFINEINKGFRIYPENDFNANLFLGICDFVKVKRLKTSSLTLPKVVVWDLDNTLWDGVLIEDGPQNIRIRPEIIETIKILDSKGIINSIISKNNFEEVYEVLKSNEIEPFFVFPKVNWNPKSENFRLLIKELNLLPSAFYFIDDNVFERQEVISQFPEISCFDQYAFPGLLSDSVFDINPTDEGTKRRASYKAEENRVIEKQKFSDNYIDFLINCKIEFELSKPITDIEISRAFELISRTNQLNLSGVKISNTDFHKSLLDSELSHFIFKVKDKFGDYGIVGYLTVRFRGVNQNLIIENLVISCRVAEKKIENACIWAISDVFKLTGDSKIVANYSNTSKNKPIFNSMLEMGFQFNESILSLNRSDLLNPTHIININTLDNDNN